MYVLGFKKATAIVVRTEEIVCLSPEDRALGLLTQYLSDEERDFVDRIPNRHYAEEWRIGRFLSKLLLHYRSFLPTLEDKTKHSFILEQRWLDQLDCKLAQGTTIRTHNERRQRIPPEMKHGENTSPLSLSISHSSGYVATALAYVPIYTVGIDLTPFKTVQPSMLKLFFTAEEQSAIHLRCNAEPFLGDKYWSIKEAVFKCSVSKESFIPKGIEVTSSFSAEREFFHAHYRNRSDYLIECVDIEQIVFALALSLRIQI